MASVTFPAAIGGNNSTVSDDSSPTTGLANGGHRTRFVPALAQIVAVATFVNTKATAAATSAADADADRIAAAASEAAAAGYASDAAASAAAAQTWNPASYVPNTRTVAGKALSANITLVKADVGLGNVDNTADSAKPISTAQAAAFAYSDQMSFFLACAM